MATQKTPSRQMYASMSKTKSSGGGGGIGRGRRETTSYLRNNWPEAETREVMQILVEEFMTAGNFTTAAYSKNYMIPDTRFQLMSFSRDAREMYNKVQNLRQRFFTPHGYLLRWANPRIDTKSQLRVEKCLMNRKTRESIHGIFASDVPEAMQMLVAMARENAAAKGDASGETADDGFVDDVESPASGSQQQQQLQGRRPGSMHGNEAKSGVVKSVDYYCDIFRTRAPELWRMSVEAYRMFLANADLQRGVGEEHTESNVVRRVGSGIAMTPGSGQLTDFQSDFQSDIGSDATTDDYATSGSNSSLAMGGGRRHTSKELVAAVGHSWHRFLGLRSRWASLGLEYGGKDDWARQEAAFLAQHLVSVLEASGVGLHSSSGTVQLTVVPTFKAPLDAGGIRMAVARSHIAWAVRPSTLADDLAACIGETVGQRELYTVVTLCALRDHPAAGGCISLALLVSHGGNDRAAGTFPHHDAVLGRLVCAVEGPLWHEYTDCRQPAAPNTPASSGDAPAPGLAFAYVQGGLRYAFFSRRRGHFFEITCADWTPTIAGTGLRMAWQPSAAAGAADVLALLRADKDKVLASMVELFGLRPFAHGFFDPPAPASGRRVSDDPRMHGSVRRRNGAATTSSSAARRARISNNSPYGAASLLSPDSAATSSSSLAGPTGSGGAMQFLSPQMPNVRNTQSLDLSSLSLPNSPFAGITLDAAPSAIATDYHPSPVDASLFPPLTDASLFAASGDQQQHHHAALAAAAAAAAAAAITGASPSIPNTVSMEQLVSTAPMLATTSAFFDQPSSVKMESLASTTPMLGTTPAFFDEPTSMQTNVYPAMFPSGTRSTGGALSAIHDLNSNSSASPAFWDVAGIALSTAAPSAPIAIDFGNAAISTGATAGQTEHPSVAVYPPLPAQQPVWEDPAPLRSVFGSTDMLMRLAQPSPLQPSYTPASVADPCGAGAMRPMDVSMSGVLPTPAPSAAASSSAAPGLLTITDEHASNMAAYFGTPSMSASVYPDGPSATTTTDSSNVSYLFDIPTTGC